ncbi:hypothetical protein [uncultured Legionella sp.]|uniref:hypothetical protein n=1 Tax=uncultured Legionella sp. TaxID=210934 RepID=UPI0026195164|nr:hypothetical protein [uncultured Legionella sp.]
MPIKKFTEDEIPSYDDHVKPVVTIPVEVSRELDPMDVADIQQQALEEYRASKAVLNESIADVATHDPEALKFAGEMSKRVLTIMEIAVELGIRSPDGINETNEQLVNLGVPQEAIDARAPGLLSELKQKNIKSAVISQNGSSVENGNANEAGFVGFSPLAIQNATEGNLRERMYIPFKTTHAFTGKLFADPDNVDLINHKLTERGEDWQLNKAAIDELRARSAGKYGGVYAYGAYASSRDGSRKSQTDEFRNDYPNHNPTIGEQVQSGRVPLSQREILGQSGSLTAADAANQHIKWQPGEAWSAIHDARDHKSVVAAEETGDLMLTGISGTTDSMLTMGQMLGMFEGDAAAKDKAMRDGMVACMGWMVDAKDHTAHEIQTGAKSFGLSYTAGPESYKQIRPGDQEFLDKITTAQAARGFKMPDEYLSAEHVIELAKEKQAEEELDVDAEVQLEAPAELAVAEKGAKGGMDLEALKQMQQQMKTVVREGREVDEPVQQVGHLVSPTRS